MGARAREAVLGRVRSALGERAGTPERQWEGIERSYRQAPSMAREAVLELFAERLKDYDAGVYVILEGEIAGTIGRVLAARGVERVAVAAGTPAAWRVEDVQFVEDAGGGVENIELCDGVLTGAVCGIAETGTIVLQNQQVGGQGRRALTLLPDYHLCVIRAADVVQTVPEAMARLEGSAGLATTFFSGPSATADIEMTRIKGVHGPRFVDVIVVN